MHADVSIRTEEEEEEEEDECQVVLCQQKSMNVKSSSAIFLDVCVHVRAGGRGWYENK